MATWSWAVRKQQALMGSGKIHLPPGPHYGQGRECLASPKGVVQGRVHVLLTTPDRMTGTSQEEYNWLHQSTSAE